MVVQNTIGGMPPPARRPVFTATHWSIVLAASATDTSRAQAALNRFCRSWSVSFGVNTPYAEPMNSCFTLTDYRTPHGVTHLGKRIYG